MSTVAIFSPIHDIGTSSSSPDRVHAWLMQLYAVLSNLPQQSGLKEQNKKTKYVHGYYNDNHPACYRTVALLAIQTNSDLSILQN